MNPLKAALFGSSVTLGLFSIHSAISGNPNWAMVMGFYAGLAIFIGLIKPEK